MLFNFLFVYIEINVICILLCVIVNFMVGGDLRNQREVLVFRAMTIVYMFMLAIDCFTQLTFRQVISVDPLLLGITYALHMSGLSLMAFLWLQFMEFEIDAEISRSKTFWAVFGIPLIVNLILIFTSIKTGLLFRINENGVYERGPYFSIQMYVSYFYFLVAAMHAVFEAARETSPIRRRHLFIVASYIIIPSIGGLLQIVFSNGVPVVAPSIAVCIFFIFTNIQREQIHHDALTGLDNRKSLSSHLDDMISKVTESQPFYLYILDADDFKKVNDVHGHQAGDKALKIIAEALKSPGIGCDRFVARFGGDEFVVLASNLPGDWGSPQEYSDHVNKELARLTDESGLGFKVSVSAGYAKCISNLTDPTMLMEEADKMLYENKRKKAA